MQYIPMSILEYRFNEEGVTELIVVAFQTYSGEEHLTTRIGLTQEYVQSINEKILLDTMNKQQVEVFARRRLRDWAMVDRPEPSEEPEVEE